MRQLPQLLIVGVAAAAALVSLPAGAVERAYSTSAYPGIQAILTSASNLTQVPLCDLAGLAIIGVLAICWWRAIREAARARQFGPVGTAAWTTLVMAAAAYLWFLAVWGLNYQRPGVDTRQGFDETRVTTAAVRALAEHAITEANRLYAPAHQAGFPPVDAVPEALSASLHEVERAMGRPRPTVPARPKRSLLTVFFRAAGVDGMLAPIALETLLNPDLTGPERPVVLAHEWAHLAGYAPEDEASFIGVLVALGADTPSQYSAWLSLAFDTTALLPAADRRALIGSLDAGPEADRQAIIDRLLRRVDIVQRASWTAYDGYLKSQGVDEGVASYGGVVRLLIGSGKLGRR